jgi:hypothetical protein
MWTGLVFSRATGKEGEPEAAFAMRGKGRRRRLLRGEALAREPDREAEIADPWSAQGKGERG